MEGRRACVCVCERQARAGRGARTHLPSLFSLLSPLSLPSLLTCIIVTTPRSGTTAPGSARRVLIREKM